MFILDKLVNKLKPITISTRFVSLIGIAKNKNILLFLSTNIIHPIKTIYKGIEIDVNECEDLVISIERNTKNPVKIIEIK